MQSLDALEPDHAASVSTQALKLMAELEVPVTPPNFTVWFAYVLGRSVALRKTIDILRSNNRKFDKALNRELFATFLKSSGSLGEAAETISEELDAILINVRNDIAGAIADTAAHSDQLVEVERTLRSTNDAQLVFKRLAEELTKATERASMLEAKLVDASGELSSLRTSLEQAELRSRIDALTGLANRGAMESFLRTAQIDAMESGNPLSVFLIDVDHFKKFNDTYGHQLGDQVLRLVANCLKEGIREGDLAARYGGEELIGILPGTALAACREIADRIRVRIGSANVKKRATGEMIGQVTISAGVAQFTPGESFEALIERCDQALYRAKQSGATARSPPKNESGEEARKMARPRFDGIIGAAPFVAVQWRWIPASSSLVNGNPAPAFASAQPLAKVPGMPRRHQRSPPGTLRQTCPALSQNKGRK